MTLIVPSPSPTAAIYGPTAGISRNLEVASVAPVDVPAFTQGGGNLNGTQATTILFAQAGTGMGRVNLPRKPGFSGNYCGII